MNLKRKKGSVFILSMVFSVIIAISIASILALQGHYHKINAKAMERTKALYLAESGIQLALHEFKHKDTPDRFQSGWSVSGNDYTFTDTDGTVYELTLTWVAP